jgi:hypothetical protein
MAFKEDGGPLEGIELPEPQLEPGCALVELNCALAGL